MPLDEPVYDTLQCAMPDSPAREQWEEEKAPLLSLKKDTVPVGVVGLAEMSVTVAVHEVLDPVLTDEGEQLISEVVDRA